MILRKDSRKIIVDGNLFIWRFTNSFILYVQCQNYQILKADLNVLRSSIKIENDYYSVIKINDLTIPVVIDMAINFGWKYLEKNKILKLKLINTSPDDDLKFITSIS